MHERGVPKTPASRRGCDFCRQIGPMEIIFVLAALLLSSIAILILLLLAAGLACIFGASFALVFRGGLWLLLLPPLCILYGWLAGRERFVVKETDIVSAEVPEGFDGFRMVQISDLHLRSFRGRRKSLERVVDKINAQRPDIVVFTGDIVTSHPDEIAPLAEILGRIASPVYSVMGNHDYCPYNRWDSAEEQAEAVREVREWEARLGWTLLDDRNVTLERGGDEISLIGVQNISSMRQFASRGNLAKAMGGADADFKILLSHDPTFWRSGVLGATDIDLTLSGHTHNAQLKLLGWEPSRLMFRENSGLYREETASGLQYLYVNDGLGETMFPARIGVPGEISVIRLRRKN